MTSSKTSTADYIRNFNQTLDEMDQTLESCSKNVAVGTGESSGLSQPMEQISFDEELRLLGDSPENTSNESLIELKSLIEDSLKYLPTKSRRFIEARLDLWRQKKGIQ